MSENQLENSNIYQIETIQTNIMETMQIVKQHFGFEINECLL